MSVQSRISELKSIVTSGCEILTDQTDASFQEHSKRWSDIGRQTPAAIVLPRKAEDIQKVVQWAVNASIPFVTKGAGHSEWSTIGTNGFIIDLTHYSAIKVDAKARTAIIKGGITQKDVAVRLAEEGLFTGKELNLRSLFAARRSEYRH